MPHRLVAVSPLLLLFWCLAACPVSAAPINQVVFGNMDSENIHRAAFSQSVVETGAFRRTCRRIGPDGHLRFTLPCEPEAPTYLTVMLWGSETGSGQLYLYNGEERVGAYQSPWPELDLLDGAPFFPGRFYYSTYLIPEEMTRGKTAVELTIGSTGRPTPYSDTVKEAPQSTLSRGIYAAATTTDPYFVPAEDDLLGEVPQSQTPAAVSGEETIAHLHEQLNRALDVLLTWQYYGNEWENWLRKGNAPAYMTGAIVIGGAKDAGWSEADWKRQSVTRGGVHVRAQMVPEIYARMYHAPWSKHYQDKELVERVVLALDFCRRAQGSDGGFVEIEHFREADWVGGPERRPGRGCLMGFGMQGLPGAFRQLTDAITQGQYLDAVIDDDADPTTPPVTRHQAYAGLFLGVRDYLVSPMGRGHAPNQDVGNIFAAYLADQCLHRLDPERAWPAERLQEYLDAACGFGPDIYGGRWLSAKGLSCEPNGISNGGYCGNYGEHVIAPLFDLARLTGQERIRDRALQVAHTMAMFRRPAIEADGLPSIRLEGVITWRNNHSPGRISYGGNPYAATVLKDPLSLRELQLALSRGHYLEYTLDRYWVHMQSTVLGLLREMPDIESAATLPPSEARLPFEAGQPDFAWADAEAGAVVVKRGGERLLMALNWRHGYKTRERSPGNAMANELARVHHRTPQVARIANVRMESIGGFRGVYVCSFGPYLVAMNASYEGTMWTVPDGVPVPRVDLITGRQCAERAIHLAPQETVVLVDE